MTNRKTILCIGDSIVEGYPYDLEDSWVAHAEQHWNRLQENPRDDLWINAGISGQLTSEIRFRLGLALDRYQPDLVILSCGTNDFIFLDGPRGEADSAWVNIQAMAAAALQSGAKVILTAPPMTIPELASRRWSDGTDYDAVNRKLEDLRQRIADWCEERAAEAVQEKAPTTLLLWDVFGGFEQRLKEEGTTLEGASRWFVDGLHPTKQGYEAMAKQLLKLLDENPCFL